MHPQTGYVDYDELEKNATLFRPKLIIAGANAYPHGWDYPRLRKICGSVGAMLMADVAHISGLEATSSPFDYCEIVTSTTHNSLAPVSFALTRGSWTTSNSPCSHRCKVALTFPCG